MGLYRVKRYPPKVHLPPDRGEIHPTGRADASDQKSKDLALYHDPVRRCWRMRRYLADHRCHWIPRNHHAAHPNEDPGRTPVVPADGASDSR